MLLHNRIRSHFRFRWPSLMMSHLFLEAEIAPASVIKYQENCPCPRYLVSSVGCHLTMILGYCRVQLKLYSIIAQNYCTVQCHSRGEPDAVRPVSPSLWPFVNSAVVNIQMLVLPPQELGHWEDLFYHHTELTAGRISTSVHNSNTYQPPLNIGLDESWSIMI